MNPRRCLLALASTVALLPAQEPGPFRFAPADSLAVVRFAAPAKWKQQFAATQVVKLFASDKLAPMIGGLSQAIDQGLAALRQNGAFDADLLEKLLTDYKGDIVIAASLDVDGLMQAIGSGEMPTFGVSVTLTADGAYDLGKLAAELQKRIEKEGHRTLHDLQVGDHRLRCTKDDDESNLSVPAMIDGQLVMLASDDIEKFATKVLGKAPRFAGNGGDGTMFAQVDLAPLMKALGEAAAASGEAPFDVAALLDALGLGCLGTATANLGATGKHLTFDSTVQFLEKERGFFGVLGKGGGSPRLLRLVPPDAETWSVSPVDFGALHAMVGNIWSAVGDSVPVTWEQAQQKITEELKVRLKEDLLDNLGGEILFVQDIETTLAGAAAEDEDDPLASLNGTCIGVALRDGKAFGDAIEKLLRSRGLHAGRKSEDYAATKVHRLRLAGVLDLEYAITDDLMLLGVGNSPASQKALRSVLDARATPPRRRRAAGRDQGCHGGSAGGLDRHLGAARRRLDARLRRRVRARVRRFRRRRGAAGNGAGARSTEGRRRRTRPLRPEDDGDDLAHRRHQPALDPAVVSDGARRRARKRGGGGR